MANSFWASDKSGPAYNETSNGIKYITKSQIKNLTAKLLKAKSSR
jgi:hypothetical protein